MKRNQEAVKDARQSKKASVGRIIEEKYQEERMARVIPLVAKTEAQKEALKAFTEKQLVVLRSSNRYPRFVVMIFNYRDIFQYMQ